jgi:hypothetical protein
MIPLTGACAHRWVDAPPSSGFWVAPYGVLGWRRLDGRTSTSTRMAAHASTRTKVVVTTTVSADELESWVAIPDDLFPECSNCESGLRRWGKLLKPLGLGFRFFYSHLVSLIHPLSPSFEG